MSSSRRDSDCIKLLKELNSMTKKISFLFCSKWQTALPSQKFKGIDRRIQIRDEKKVDFDAKFRVK